MYGTSSKDTKKAAFSIISKDILLVPLLKKHFRILAHSVRLQVVNAANFSSPG